MCPQPDSHPEPTFYLSLPHGEIAVHAYGRGPKTMIALHGFDDSGTSFQKWEDTYGDAYTIYAPDLPFHGRSQWKKKQINQADACAIVNSILLAIKQTNYTLVGHSFGGRLILCATPDVEHEPQQVILLAPAGIGNYNKVIPIGLQKLTEMSLRRPGWLRLVVKLGGQLGLLSKFHQRYAEAQLYPPKQRYRLFRVFNSARAFPTNTRRIKNFWHRSSIACLVVVAEKDRLVPSEKIKRFFAPMPGVEVLEVIGSHDLINERIALLVKEKLA
jgi:pimeloyl-ACP methyl ester carboxylesterase